MDAQFERERESLVIKFASNEACYQTGNFPPDEIADLPNSYWGPSPYHVNYCGYEVCHPGYTFGPKARTSYLLHVVYSGSGKYYAPDRTYDVSGNQIFLIYPDVITTYQADFETPWTYGWIGFSGPRSESILSSLGFSPDNLVLTVYNTDPLHQCILNIMDTHKITYANELTRTAELLHFFAYIADHQVGVDPILPSYSKSVYAHLAMRYLETNFMTNIKISDLAEHIGIDRSHLTKSFREEYRISPQEYLIRLRIEHAEHLLKTTTDPVSVIAAKVGYSDALAFSKIFKQRIGLSPSGYRKQNEE